ncbi:DUF402 domain-containing protein [Deinococcus cavernae]|uniref:DUF402 domain-containing protein n=1 Tax=Deinococcus cavernae TaxID=2320857 RepID=A0A418V4I4_9DEIO|nr:DUF402 domain-containing protein [Deinococcus cavernae]RJF71026.1 DUF402 domain-containing protein [Deinococcus cavernae]
MTVAFPPKAPPVTPHPVKTERHDTRNRTHHTNTGVRPVHTYRPEPHGLFVSRPFQGHPRIRHWQAHLLPTHNLVVCHYDFHHQREHDYYLDVALISVQDDLWTVRDLYLDVVLREGHSAVIVDTDELIAGHAAGFITHTELHLALEVAHHTLSALSAAQFNLHTWATSQGVQLDWDAPHGEGAPPSPAHA